jgi:hypothetical protein
MPAIASPQSTVGSVHQSTPLTNFSLGYHPSEDGFIADQIFPVVPVTHETDLFYKWDLASAFRVEQSDGYGTLVADGAAAPVEDFGFTIDSYTAQAFARAVTVTDRQLRNADSVLNLQYAKTRRAQSKIMLDMEIRVAATLTTAANFASANTSTLSGTAQWNNASFASQTANVQSVIKKNIDDACEAIRLASGQKPNTIIIPEAVRRVMSRDVGLMDEIKWTTGGLTKAANGDIIGDSLFGLKVLNPWTPYTTAIEGEPAANPLTDIWGKNLIIAYVAPTPGIDSPALGYIFRQRPWMVRSWRDERISTTFYEASIIQAEKQTSNIMGYLYKNVIA